MTDHRVTRGVLKSFLLVGLFQIADIPKGMEDKTKALITEEDDTVNTTPANTCRVWLFRVLDRLKISGVLRCSDSSILEQEIDLFVQSCILCEVAPRCITEPLLSRSRVYS